MDDLLKILKSNALEKPEDLAKLLSTTAEDVARKIDEYEKSGVIKGYQAVLDEDLLDGESVRAFIEVKVQPECEGGFDRIARRIAAFDEVESLFLMSGKSDLLLIVNADSLKEAAFFVSEKLAPIRGVSETSTAFNLKVYKYNHILMEEESRDDRLKITP
jgi:DNA-binding Lrp family transcriptional regulator